MATAKSINALNVAIVKEAKKFYIWNKADGEFLPFQYDSEQEAIEKIACYEDAYLMHAVKMHEEEFLGRLALSELYSAEDASAIDAAIQNDLLDKTSGWLYAQIGACLSLGRGNQWIGELYSKHFKSVLLNECGGAGEDYEGNGDGTKLLSFQQFLDDLRKEIDYAEDYDSAFLKHNKK